MNSAALRLIASGFVCAVPAARLAHREWRTRRWPRTKAVVDHVNTIVYRPFFLYRRVSNREPYPDLRYHYTVHGAEYMGTNWREGLPIYFSQASMRRRFPKGSTVSIAYGPSQPSNSVMEPGVDGTSILTMVVGFILASVGVAWWLAG